VAWCTRDAHSRGPATDGVVFGSGPVGLAVISELLAQGKHVRVASRSGARRGLPATVEVLRGDATNPEDTRRVCAGASHVYSCVNAPDHHRCPSSSRRSNGASWPV
jgi:uncharacterized protein YbjT (DUF2867 family)